MALEVPPLDNRKFQDIVDEAKKRISHYCPEWTDHNVSDPGVTLIELFAWMTDIILYRLNQVPDLHYVKMMEMLGIKLKGPKPARALVTFWLSAPKSTPYTIDAGTEVATTQTEQVPSVVFSTDEELRVQPPQWVAVASRVTGSDRPMVEIEHELAPLQAGVEGKEREVPLFGQEPKQGEAFCLGFENDLSHHILVLDVKCTPAGGHDVVPEWPPYVWEASSWEQQRTWEPCGLDPGADCTRAFNQDGTIQLHLPKMGLCEVAGRTLYWVRARNDPETLAKDHPEAHPYTASPRLRRLAVSTWGGTVRATHAQIVKNELLGRSDGTPGQRFQLQRTPALGPDPEKGETLLVRREDGHEDTWIWVPHFGAPGSDARHYTLDHVTGEVRFPPVIRQPNGEMGRYGDIPPRGAEIIYQCYRHGGGVVGNVGEEALNTLKTSISDVARVRNRKPAEGGQDAELLQSAMMCVPGLLSARERAVTAADFEELTWRKFGVDAGEVDQVRCLQRELDPAQAPTVPGVAPGHIYVLVVPHVKEAKGYVRAEDLELKDDLRDKIEAYLNTKRLLTSTLEVRKAHYHHVAVQVAVQATVGSRSAELKRQVEDRLYRYFSPLKGGGPDEKGWPFERSVYPTDVFQCLQGLAGVQWLRSVEIYEAHEVTGKARGNPVKKIKVEAYGVVASGQHEVTVETV